MIVNNKILKDLDFAVYKTNYITLRVLYYDNIIVPKGYIFDGVTVKPPFTIIFSNKDLRQGIRASCFHDWLCNHKSEYELKYATNILVNIWREDGLNIFKSFIVKFFVNLFQIFKGGWKKC